MEAKCKAAWEVYLEVWDAARSEGRDYNEDDLILLASAIDNLENGNEH